VVGGGATWEPLRVFQPVKGADTTRRHSMLWVQAISARSRFSQDASFQIGRPRGFRVSLWRCDGRGGRRLGESAGLVCVGLEG